MKIINWLKKFKNKLIVVCSMLSMMFLYNHCGNPFGNSKSGLEFDSYETPFDQQPEPTAGSPSPSNPSAQDPELSLAAFESTVYVLTRRYCINCHGSGQQPVHADANVQTAHDSVLNNYKVDFNNPAQSRMVLKLSQANHNCWSNNCNNDAAEMLAAVQSWKDQSFVVVDGDEDNGSGILGNGSEISIGEAGPISDLFGVQSNNDIVIDMYASTLKAPMTRATDMATSLPYIWVPNGNGGNLANNNAAAGWANIQFNVTTAGMYKLYGLVSAPNGEDNSFYVKVDNGNYNEWKIETLTGNSFAWREMRVNNEANQVVFNLAAGTHMLEVRQREDGTKIGLMVATTDPNFTGYGIYGSPEVTLSYDLSTILGEAATFKIDVEEFDLYSYKFSRPRIESATPVAAKGLKVYVNGSYNPQYSTYTYVDTLTAPPANTLLSNYSMIVLKSNGTDQDVFGFTFEVLQLGN